MLLTLTLTLWLTATPTPDLIDIRQAGADHLVLGAGAWCTGRQGVARSSGRRGWAPMSALQACDGQRGVAVGPGGRMRVSLSGGRGWRPVKREGAKDLWAVDAAGCARVLTVPSGPSRASRAR